ncbi:class II myosin [Candidozyma auris]
MSDDFSTKNWVWVPDKDELFARGFITEYKKNGLCSVTVVKNGTETTIELPQKVLENCNPPKFNKCDDMAELTHLNEPSVIYNLFLRYNDDLIYTYSGLFLVAINPYKSLPIYDTSVLKKFHSSSKSKKSEDRLPPHIFAIAENTYMNMLENGKDQSILVTGESGAGKTENTKKVIQYLSSISTNASSDHANDIHNKILRANPILESFGNAKTIKNNNSSRFGKFIKISFDPKGLISGATIDYYLLEKSRVSHQSSDERNYHAFYQLLRGETPQNLKSKYHLEPSIKKYNYISSSVATIPNVDDAREFTTLIEAFTVMGFEKTEIDSIFMTLAIILHLGNVGFTSWKSEQTSFDKDSNIDVIAKMLGIDSQELSTNLLRPRVKAGREFVQKSRKAAEVKQTIDAFAKHLYEKVFQFIIARINENLGEWNSDRFIGVLDIAGFEIFETNSFEQLCINYTNEKLQQFFNHHSFILEQSEYLREDIQWEFIDFGLDLQPTIDLIETKQPMGILEILDDQCIMPKASDETFIDKLLESWADGKSKSLRANKVRNGFIIDHYAGLVDYNIENWIQKNTDPVSENIVQLLHESSNEFVQRLFQEDVESKLSGNMSPKKKGSKLKTVSQKHKEQLSTLMDQLNSTEPHFVRCILPNLSKRPNKFDKELVLNQLRCNGVLEGIRIARAGYPNKMTFEEFYGRYAILNSNDIVFTKNMKTNSELILKDTELDPEVYKLGITKIFFKNGILGKLEELRDLRLKKIITEFQSAYRGQAARVNFKSQIATIQASQVVARNFQKLDELVNEGKSPWLKLFVSLKPLLEDSVKVLDSKEMNESLKQINAKLKDTENAKNSLEQQNDKLKTQLMKLEDEIIKNNQIISEKGDMLRKLQSEESSRNAKLEETARQLKEVKAMSTKLSTEKAELSSEMDALKAKLEKTEKEVETLTSELANEKQRAETLQSQIGDLENEKRDLKENDEVTNGLKKKVESLEAEILALKSQEEDFQASSRELDELRDSYSKHKKKVTDLESLKVSLERKITSMESAYDMKRNTLASKHMEETSALQSQHEEAQKKIRRLEDELAEKLSEIKDHESKHKALSRNLRTLESQLRDQESLQDQLDFEKKRNSRIQVELESCKDELARQIQRAESHSSSLESLRHESQYLARAKAEYSDEIAKLKDKVRDLKSKLQNKENVPPNSAKSIDPSLADEFAQIKLKLNESNAVIRKEKFENQRLTEEVKALREKVHDSFESPSKRSSELRRSMAMGEEAKMALSNGSRTFEEIKNLRVRLKQEEANVTRAENYAIELQKKLNKLQMSRGINSSNDFEAKYYESQKRISELEKRVGQAMSMGSSSSSSSSPKAPYDSQSLTPSSSIGSLSTVVNSGDFARIYKDIVGTLRTTRDELSKSKSEILRLKTLLRESEDELYEVKRSGVKTAINDYEETLAKLKVQNETLNKRHDEVNESLLQYKKRSEQYYDKLELAESAVVISKRHEQEARTELESKSNELKLLREEVRASERVIKQLRQAKNELEEALKKQSHREEQLESSIKQLEDRLQYLNDNYGEKKHKIGEHKEEIRLLRQEIKFKMEKETELIKESQRLKLENDELVRIKKKVLAENEEVSEENDKLSSENEDLKVENENLKNDKIAYERKIENHTKQMSTLKQLLDDNAREMQELSGINKTLEETKARLEEEVASLEDSLRDTRGNLDLVREHLSELEREKINLKEELKTVKDRWDSSDGQYKSAKTENLVMVRENESVKKTNEELKSKISDLEEKLYSNEQLKYLEQNLSKLNSQVDRLKHEIAEGELREEKLQKQIRTLEFENESKTTQMKRYNDENFNYQNMINQYNSKVEFLHQENSEKDLKLKAQARELADLRERLLMMEKDRLMS